MKLALTITALSATACTIDSTTVDTSQASATLQARANGDHATSLDAMLSVGNSTVELVGDDHLVATFEGRDLEMVREDGAFASIYATSFRSDRGGDQFVIKLMRGDRADATSILTLPPPFEIAPLAETASRAQDLAVRWSAQGRAEPTDTMRWSLSGSCVESAQASIPAQSIGVDLPAGTLVKQVGPDIPDTCTVTIGVVREREGQLDARYDGGRASATQHRSITFTSTP
jgi:hypothetical protein